MNTANLVRRTSSQFYSVLQKSNSALVAHRYSSSSSASSSSTPSSSSNGGRSNEILVVTENAAKQLRNIASSGEHLRICVDSGGCSGFEYKMTLDNEKVDLQEDEVLRPADGVTIVVDKTSLEFIRGAKLDYVQDLMRAAFRITENPKATNGCSCGASFAPKDIVE